MPLNEKNFAETINSLSNDEKIIFYYSFARQLTVACRSVWAEGNLSTEQKLEAMKMINEIMHMILAKADHERLQTTEWKDEDIIKEINHYSSLVPYLKPLILWAMNLAYEYNFLSSD